MKSLTISFNHRYPILIYLLVSPFVHTSSQEYTYTIKRTDEEITIDGHLSEKVWDRAQIAMDFTQRSPKDNIPSDDKTIVRLAADARFLYLGAVCHLNEGERFQANTLYRDFEVLQNDAFMFLIDTYAKGLNGYSFEVSPFGSRGERLISNGGVDENDSDYNWENKWFSSVRRLDNSWIIEMAIPLKTLRFAHEVNLWKINFIRNNRSANRSSSWVPIPVNIDIANLSYTGNLQWEQVPESSKFKYSIIPSITTTLTKDYTVPDKSAEKEITPSLDLKLGLGSNLNLDITGNPDFSQIEVDRQQLNIGRFELFFPEKRQFFLENSDLFANFGNDNIRPFFSRRIGIASNLGGNFEAVPIIGGLRLSGKVGNKSRLGVMDVLTDEISFVNEALGSTSVIKGKNHFVATYQYQLFERSTASVLLVDNREVSSDSDMRNSQLVGGQLEWISRGNSWSGSGFYFHDFKHSSSDLSYGLSLRHSTQHFGMFSSFTHVGKAFNPETGFIPRNNVNRIGLAPFYIFRPENPKINNIDVFFDTDHTLSNNFKFLDSRILTGTFLGLSNTSSFLLAINSNYTFLLNDFDPSFSKSEPLLKGTEYFYPSLRIRYRSDQKKFLSGSLELEYGKYFNGKKLTLTSTANLRWQPYLEVEVDVIYNDIDLKHPNGDNQIILIRPQARISFNRNLFLTYITQYNSLQKNIGSNFRLQWRFRPVSDLFLVYTDNYTEDFIIQQRGFSLKLIYWL